MAGKSRRRTAAAAAADAASAAGTEGSSVATAAARAHHGDDDEHGVVVVENVLWIVLEQLDLISKTKSRCLDALQALSDGKCSLLLDATDNSSSSSKAKSAAALAAANEPHDGYWIVLATHVLNRLLRQLAILDPSNETTTTTTTSSSSSRASSSNNNTTTTASTLAANDLLRREISWILAQIALRLTQLLFGHDKTRVEKTVSSGTVARNLLGRTLGSITLASVRAMERICQTIHHNHAGGTSTTTTPDDMDGSAMLAAAVALDTVVHFQPIKPTSSDLWNRAQTSLLATASASTSTTTATPTMDVSRFQSACDKVSKLLGMSTLEGPLIHLLLVPASSSSSRHVDTPTSMDVEDEAEPTTTAAPKRNLRRAAAIKTDVDSPSPLLKAWDPVLKSMAANTVPMEGGARVSIRRWPSIVLISLDQGQERLLHHVLYRQLLQEFDSWAHVMECPAAPPSTADAKSTGETTTTTKKKAPRGASSAAHIAAVAALAAAALKKKTDKASLAVPGNVTVMALVCRLLQTFSEAVHLCGHRPPTNGMDVYVNAIWKASASEGSGAITPTPSKRIRKSKSSSAASSFAAAAAADATATLVTTDFRHLATAILYKLLQNHMTCLADNIPKSISLVNDDDDLQLQELSHATYYPLVHRAVDSLCRVSPFGSGTVLEQADMTKKLLTLSACWILQMQQPPPFMRHVGAAEEADDDDEPPHEAHGCVDAKLSNFAIAQLGECLMRMEQLSESTAAATVTEEDSAKPQDVSSSTTTTPQEPPTLSMEEEEEQIQGVIDKYHLLVPLSEPFIPKPPPTATGATATTTTKSPTNKRKHAAAAAAAADDATAHSTQCTFAGVLALLESADQTKLGDEGVLALLVRSTVLTTNTNTTTGSHKKSSTNTNVAAMLSKLMDLMQVCYDTPTLGALANSGISGNDSKVAAAASASSDSKKRAAASTPATRSRRKKRKVTKKGRQEEAFDESESGANNDGSVRSRINSVRAGLATEVANCLRIILTVPTPSGTKIQNMLRKTFGAEHVDKIVKLGDMLDDVILKTRMKPDTTPSQDKSSSSKMLFSQTSSKDFTHFERSLWSAHMNLCVTIGRGKLAFVFGENNTAATNDKVLLLRNIDSRLSMFRTVSSSGHHDSGRKSGGWPLWLPVAHHALLVANMTSEPMPKTSRESSPERFLVQSFVTGITAMLEDLSKIPAMDLSSALEGQTRLDVGIPLSLRNARLLALAFIRIDQHERQTSLNKIVSSLASSLSNLRDDEEELLKTAAVSGFLARVITTCITLANLIIVKDSLHDPLLKLMGPAQYKLTGPASAEKWYTEERCFMGLFSDWESPTFPVVPVRGNLSEISSDTASKLNTSLKLALTLGLESAKADRCHLLFSAWNGLSLGPLWNPPVKTFPTLPTNLASSEDSLLLLSQMRDDICTMNELLEVHSTVEGMASKMRRERNGGREGGTPVKTKLQEMIKRADTLSSSLLTSFASGDDRKQQEVLPENFSLFSGLSVYVAYAVAKHTIPGTTFLANSQASTKRSRGYLTECVDITDPEELAGAGCSSDSEGESELDEEIDVLTKLHDACQEFGASPCHPDWIDSSCSLRSGVSASEAMETSSAALRCLSKIASAACSQYHLCWQRAMRILSKHSPDSDTRIALALQLSTFPTSATDSSGSNQLKDSVGLVCGIDSAAMDMLFFEYDASVQDSMEAFCPNASQWIFGQRPHPSVLTDRWSDAPGELRALGEWELLMSAVLVESCHEFGCGDLQSGSNIPEKNFREAHLQFANAERWRCVFERAVSNMMPASALFRMAVSGVGRTSHPLNSENVTFDDIDQGSLEFVEPVPSSVSKASSEQATTVLETLATLVWCASKCRGHQMVLDSCQAVATNLLVDSKAWLDLEAIEAFRSVSTMLVGLRSILPNSNVQKSQQLSQALTSLVAFLTTYLGSPHQVSRRLPFTSHSTQLSRIIASFGPNSDFRFDTVGGKGYDTNGLLSVLTFGWDPENLLPFKEKFGAIQKPALLAMVSALCCDRILANGKSRAFFALILRQLAWLEGPHSSEKNVFVIPAIIDAFNGIQDDTLKRVVSVDVCSSDETSCDIESGKDRESFRENLCFLFAFLLGQAGSRFKDGKKVLTVLIAQFSEISKIPAPSRENVLNLLFLYASRYGSLGEVGSLLMSNIQNSTCDESRATLDCAVRFFGFVCDLRRRLHNHNETSPTSTGEDRRVVKDDRNPESDDVAKSLKRPKLCSFAGMSGYHWQHWYNCYSCGLIGDTGCCTLCALACHRDHEVSYSRYSSFFCDCGAENAAASEEQKAVHCKCLSPLSDAEVDNAFEGDMICIKSEDAVPEPERRDNNNVTINALALDIAHKVFGAASSKAVQDLLVRANVGNWVQSLLKLMSSNSDSVAPKVRDDSLAKSNSSSTTTSDKDTISDEGALQKSLLARRGKPLDLLPLTTQMGMVPIRAVKTSTFQLKLSVDNVSDQPKRAVITKSDNKRTAVVADSRGRLIVAEQRSLVFCSAAPVVNVRYEENACEVPFGRAQMNVLGSSALGFLVVGMELCRENERCVVAWGVTEACVVVLSTSGDSVEKKFELVVDPGHQEGDSENVSIVKCQWVPGSATTAVVACGPFVRVYDIGRDQANRVPPIIGFFLGYDTVLRDLAIVPVVEQQAAGNESTNSPRASIYKLLLLLGNGQVHSVDLKFDKEGTLETPGEQCFESSEGLALPVEGVRTHCGSALGPSDAVKKTFGEGSSLTYLTQSGLVLYRCTSSCVLALLLDTNGKIAGSFELLPNVIKPDVLGVGPDGYGVSGPYVNWTELGTINEGTDKAFCLACVGKSTRTSQPKLLLVVFNAHFVKVKLLAWPSSGPLGLGLSLISSFEGLTAFSVPSVGGEISSSGSLWFRERACLAAATSNGSILFFGEELGITPVHEPATSLPLHGPMHRNRLTKNGSIQEKKPSFPLTIFETLTSVEKDNLRFGGECMGEANDIKQPLLRENNVLIVSPNREGCSLTICLWKNDQRDESQAIVALRVLVGSNNLDCIPQRVFLEGRPVELTANTKRWYDMPLTEEEVALSLRNGFVALGIGPSFDSLNNPTLDAVEVFTVERTRIDQWLPKRLSDTLATEDERPKTVGVDDVVGQSILLPCSQALAFLCEFLGSRQSLGQADRETLKRLLQATALDSSGDVRCSLMVLLKQIEPDERARAALVDEAVLAGCAEALAQLSIAIANNSNIQGVVDMPLNFQQKPASDVLFECLKVAAAIATDRPVEYLRSIENMASAETAKFSTALEVIKILEDGKLIVGERLVAKFVELCLAEIAISGTLVTKDSNLLANFKLISKLLASPKFAEWCCSAMSSFCVIHCNLGGRKEGRPSFFAELQAARPQMVAYQCDCCAVCPILETRYAVLEGDHDIDLCQDCYRLGLEYAEEQDYAATANVLIDGKVIGGSSTLNCAQINQMQPVPITRADVESLETAHLLPGSSVSHGVTTFPDTTRNVEEGHDCVEGSLGQAVFDDFCGEIFDKTLELVHASLTRDRPAFNLQIDPMLKFLLEVIRHSSSDEERIARSEKFAEKISMGLSRLLQSALKRDELDREAGRKVLVTCLRAFADLVVTETDVGRCVADSREAGDGDGGLGGEKPNRVLCEAHNFPASRRRCAHGVDKDRRFYVCGKEKAARCDFFVWADEIDKGTNSSAKPKSRSDPVVQSFLWELLLSLASVDSTPMHVQICTILEQDIATATAGRTSTGQSNEISASTADAASTKGHNHPEDLLTEYHDGVFCSREKLQGSKVLRRLESVLPVESQSRSSLSQRSSRDSTDSMLEASLDLFAALAGTNSGSPQDESSGVSRWYPLLCEIISSSEENNFLRAKAKRVLKAFCGGSRAKYHAVRDHFVFGFQFRNFLRNAEGVLDTSLAIVEQARQCSLEWKTSEKVEWSALSAGGLLGCQDLVSEDALSVQCERDIAKILDEIWNVIKSRGGNWRRFCGLFALPRSHREGSQTSQSETRTRPGFNAVFAVPPIVALFWTACSLRGSNQLKAMMLVDAALVNWAERKGVSSKAKGKASGNSTTNESLSSDDEMNQELSEEKAFDSSNSKDYTTPESILLTGPSQVSISELHAFVMQFVCCGRTTQVRKVACHITCKLFQALDEAERVALFTGLAAEPLDYVGAFGKASVDFLMLLQTTLRIMTPSILPITDIAERTAARSLHQLRQLRFCGDWIVFDVGSGSSASKKRVDLSLCVNCHRAPTSTASKESSARVQEGENTTTPRDALTRAARPPGASAGARSQGKSKWLPEQVQPYVRRRLDGSKDDSVSNEFATFVQLKLRLAISEVHVSVSDPRGRYVKTITVFFTPRPVADVDVLKTDDYSGKWQRCATLSLARGANRASCTLPVPIVASNLKFEYTEFYERAGGSKASDGSLLVHCPRCTRVVQNAHGVCGNCGEVAFQCRKCRHINYDRLDAFLCVECGYCAAGNFSYEVTGGVASNAVSVTNDEDYERSLSILGAATKLSGEIRTALTEHIEGASRQRKTKTRSDGDPLSGLTPDVKRAFRGEFPLVTNWKGDDGDTDRRFPRLSTAERLVPNGSVVASIACSETSGSRRSSGSNVVDRTRNLLRIARQIRSDSSGGRRSTSDVILRHFGRGLSIDSLDDEGDIMDLLEGASGGVLGSSDPLGRLVASIQSRSARDRERSEAETRQAATGGSGGGSGSSKTDPASTSKDVMNECEKLYQLSREAERECAEFNRRIAAWKRLESGCLLNLGAGAAAANGPSHCTACCGAMALHLLQLWHRLFLTAPDQVHVSKQLLTALLDESIALPKSLVDLKRSIVRDVATKSPAGSKLVLGELRTRIAANCDMASSEILGQILENVDVVENCDFMDLAIKVLEE